MAKTTTMVVSTRRPALGNSRKSESTPTSTTTSVLPSPSFWKDIHKIRNNSFEHIDTTAQQEQPQQPTAHKWTFRSRKSHILDSHQGYYTWQRELNCYQAQSLPEAVFPDNTLEITVQVTNDDDNDNDNECLRIRFGALEGLRGWMSLDAPPIPTVHALDSPHWKRLAALDRLPTTVQLGNNNKNNNIHTNTPSESLLSTSYDYAYTTPYKGGTDVISLGETTTDHDDEKYSYLKPDSTSFVSKHDVVSKDRSSAPKATSTSTGIQRRIVVQAKPKPKLRKPICKCKSDGGRAPLVSAFPNKQKQQEEEEEDTTEDGSVSSPVTSKIDRAPNRQKRKLPSPTWKLESHHRVEIEGMLQRAARANPGRPFWFREDVDLWQDDLHDNGIAWLKARCFVCQEGWACLLRNFVRVDGVLCRVIDTRYSHTFGSRRVLREHSWKEGPWEYLVRAMAKDRVGMGPSTSTSTSTTTATTNMPLRRPPPPSTHMPSAVSLESINDSVAARYLPLRGPPQTECLSLHPPSVDICPVQEQQQQQQKQKQLVMIHDATIDDAIPVPNQIVQNALGISFVLKRSKGTALEAIGSGRSVTENSDSRSVPVSSLWSKDYNDRSDNGASILSVQISPDPTDGGRLAVGDDRGMVRVWRLTTGESLGGFPVAPLAIRDRLMTNPYFESAKLWVDHLVWNADGSRVGAAAGRIAVLASVVPNEMGINRVLSTLESTSGTVTGLAFQNRPGRPSALAVASYGQVRWLAAPGSDSEGEGVAEPLLREGAAVECIDVSPNGEQVAVGFLDKTLRVFSVGSEQAASTMNGHSFGAAPVSPLTTTSSFRPKPTNDDTGVVDWVGFNAAVKSVRFSPQGHWLAAMGGNAVLVIHKNLCPRSDPPIVCRTPGKTEADGGDGTCHRFEEMVWSTEDTTTTSASTALLAALDAKTKSVHIFRFSENGSFQNQHDAWPVRAMPLCTVSPSFANPSLLATMRFSFFSNVGVASKYSQNDEDNIAFFVLDRCAAATTDEDSNLPQQLGSKLRLTEGGNSTKNDDFCFRIVL